VTRRTRAATSAGDGPMALVSAQGVALPLQRRWALDVDGTKRSSCPTRCASPSGSELTEEAQALFTRDGLRALEQEAGKTLDT